MVKLLAITWSNTSSYNLEETLLYKSFIKNNPVNNLLHIHYNREDYVALEKDFKSKFGYQYEFLLYKIYLIRDKIKDLAAEHIIVSDVFDVVCLGNIQKLNSVENIIFSSESNQYPSSRGDWGTPDYSQEEYRTSRFLNAGMFICTKNEYLELLNTVIEKVFPLQLKSLGGDQGVFTYHYLSNFNPKITLDKENRYFFNTYTLDHNRYVREDFPIFVHDNGWNYGSPRFIEKFNLV